MNENKILSPKVIPYLILGLAILWVSYVRLQFLEIPFERDEGEYCYHAQLLLEGKIPYLDFYEQKPPGLFYSYAFLQAIFGNSLSAVHVAFLLVNILSLVFIFGFCKRLFDPWAAAMASWSFALVSLSKMAAGFSAQAEHLIVLSFVAALFYLQKALDQHRKLYWIIGGFLLSWGVLIKQNGIFFLFIGLAFILNYYYLKTPSSWASFLKKMGYLSFGILAPLLFCSFILWYQNAFEEMFFWVYQYPKSYIGQYDLATGLRRFTKNMTKVSYSYQGFWLLGLSALFISVFVKKANFPKVWFWVLASLSFVAIVPGFRFYGHYFLLLSPCLAILCGLAFYLSKIYISNKLYPWLPLALISLMFISNIFLNKNYYFHQDHTKLLREVYHTNPFQEAKIISDYLKENSKVDEQIAVWGSEPQINFYTNRKAPSRHCFFLFLISPISKTATWQKELIQETEQAKPRYIVKVQHPYSGNITAKTLKIFYPWSIGYLKQHYQLIGLSEIYNDKASSFLWEEAVLKHQINSPYQLLVYQRKD